MSARAFADLVAIGRLVKPQGRRGELALEPLSDRPERFRDLRRAFLPGPGGLAREIVIETCWPHKGRFVVKLQGIDSIDAADTLRGQELRIGEEELAPLEPDAYYHHQLVGLRVEDEGRELGRVERIWETGAPAPVLVVQGAEGETLLPFAAGFIREVDLQAGVLRVRQPGAVTADAAL